MFSFKGQILTVVSCETSGSFQNHMKDLQFLYYPVKSPIGCTCERCYVCTSAVRLFKGSIMGGSMWKMVGGKD